MGSLVEKRCRIGGTTIGSMMPAKAGKLSKPVRRCSV